MSDKIDEPQTNPIEEKLQDKDLSQKDADEINELSKNKKWAEAIKDFLNTEWNQEHINTLIENAFSNYTLDQHTANVWNTFKNSLKSEKVNKKGVFNDFILKLETKISEFQNKINDNNTIVAKEEEVKAEKEKGSKDLSDFLKLSVEWKSEAQLVEAGKHLFENNKPRFEALFDQIAAKDKTTLDDIQQKNLSKYLAAYIGIKPAEATFDKISTEIADGNWTYAKETKILKVSWYTDRHIVFGSFDQAQKDKADVFEKSGKKKAIEDLLNGDNKNGEYKNAIVWLADVWSYKVFETIIKDKPDLLQKLLANGFLKQLMDANDLLTAKKAVQTGAEKSSQAILKLQLADQQKWYIEAIRNAILGELKTNGNIDPLKRADEKNTDPATEKARTARGLFHEYMLQIKDNPGYLGNDLNGKVWSFNEISRFYINYRNANPGYFNIYLPWLPINQINSNPQTRIDQETRTMFNVVNKNVRTEINKEYGLASSLQKLFAEFKDEIVTVLEALGLNKEAVLHRCGGNKALEKSIKEAYEKAYKLDDKDKAILKDIHHKGTVFDELTKVKNYNAKPNESTKDIVEQFKTGKVSTKDDKWVESITTVDFKKAYIDYFKTIDAAQVDGNFIRSLIDSNNTNNPNNKINADDYLTSANTIKGDWTVVLEKAWNDKLIWDTITLHSDALADMAEGNKPNGKETRDSKFKEAANSTIQSLWSNPMLAVSYYLSTMILAGNKDLKYKVTENRGQEAAPDQKKDIPPKQINTITIKTDKKNSVDSDGKILEDTELADIVDATNGAEYITIHQDNGTNIIVKKSSWKYNNFSDKAPAKLYIGDKIQTSTPEEINTFENTKIEYTIKQIEARWTKAENKTKTPKTDFTANDTDYKTNVIDPIIALYTDEKSYNIMRDKTTEDKYMAKPLGFKFLLQARNIDHPDSKIDDKIIASIKDKITKINFSTENDQIIANITNGKDTKKIRIEKGRNLSVVDTKKTV